jgi:hypothetical protein
MFSSINISPYHNRSLKIDIIKIIKGKVNQSRYRPGVAQRVPGS